MLLRSDDTGSVVGRARGPAAGRTRLLWLLLQVTIVVAGIVTYFGVRGLTAGAPHTAQVHAEDIVALEQRLGIHIAAASQGSYIDSDLVTTAANWIYIWGHWPVIAATMIWLALYHRRHFLRLRNAMLVSGGIGLFIYALYPVAPPRLAGMGFVDTVAEQSRSYRVLQPPAFVNQYAAMPSLHVGWDLLVGVVIAGAAGTVWLRWIGRVMPVLMVLAVVVTANHYVLDVLGGATLALFGLFVAIAIESGQVRRVVRAPRALVDRTAAPLPVPAPRRPAPRLPSPRPSRAPHLAERLPPSG